MTIATPLIIDGLLMAAVVLVIVGGLLWAVATQHRDHGVFATGPVFRRRLWSRSSRPHAGSRKPLYAPARRRQTALDF
jgi:hypothetical protein